MNTIVQYQMTEAETVEGMLKIKRHLDFNRHTWILLGLAGILIVFYSRTLPYARGEKYFWIGCMTIGMAVSIAVLIPRYIRRAITRYVQSNPALFTTRQEMTFTEEGMVFSSADIRQGLNWDIFKVLKQDDGYIYLYSNSYGPIAIVPKRAFDSVSLTEFLRCSQSLQQA